MSTLDREFLKQLSFSQSELARCLRTTRQAVCAGIKQEDDYLDSNRLLRLYDTLRSGGDRRVVMVAKRLKEHYGIEVDSNAVTPTINGEPSSFPQDFKEMWVFADESLELTCPYYVSRMLMHFRSPEKTFLYFVSKRELGDRLVSRIKMEIESLKRNGQETARIHILLCNAVMFMPHFMIFNPISNEAKGYVRVTGGFAEMDPKLTGLLVANFATAGVRSVGNEILMENSGFDGVSFKILCKL